MRVNIKKYYLKETFLILLFGTLLHYVYEWSGNNQFIGIFGAINESTWEHLKLLFWPTFILSIFEYIYIGKNFNNLIIAKCVSLYVGLILIIALFYTYTGVIGYNILFIDIMIFVVSVIISQYIGYKIMVSDKEYNDFWNIIAVIGIAVLMIFFVIFTFNPPDIPLFEVNA